MKDIAVAMITMDRTPTQNYLRETLLNLQRAGVFASDRLRSFDLLDSGSPGLAAFLCREVPAGVDVRVQSAKRSANRNAATALRTGAESGAKWVLFLEDDIDVCGSFLDGVGAWLDDVTSGDHGVYAVYALGANYTFVADAAERGLHAVNYPVAAFYGTQAMVLRRDVAVDLASWLEAHEFDLNPDGIAYDLHMHQWAKARGIEDFLVAAPSFVQHIGRASIVQPRAETHTFPSWPGREWTYTRKERVA
jgi:hypothetical protein